ncbi:hypothetical protein BVC80_1183g30 [Macleaya cordata]|uniref:Phospholipase-like n=1 Tax=Macleaya cordata TaxID=56857 RepID=A0A200PQ48_MACCD|nr:hypothetical protein BVC80_1183g30 [Macleaya cordata]
MKDGRDEEFVCAAPTVVTDPNPSRGPTSASSRYSLRSTTPSLSTKSFSGEEVRLIESEDFEYMIYLSKFLGREYAKDGNGEVPLKSRSSGKDTRDEGEFIPPQDNKGITIEVNELVEGVTASLTTEDDETIGFAYVDGADSSFCDMRNIDPVRPAKEVLKIPKEPSMMSGAIHGVLPPKELARVSGGVDDPVDDGSASGPNFDDRGDDQGVGNNDCLAETSELVGGFWIDKKFVPLYKKIWCQYGHIATRKVIRTSTVTLVALVADLLEAINMMTTVRCAELTPVMLALWDGQIADAESLQFNVAWLRAHFEEVKKKWEATTLLKASLDSHEQALRLAMDRHKALSTTLETLRAQVSATEDALTMLEAEIAQHNAKVEEGATAREKYLSFIQKTVLEDVV